MYKILFLLFPLFLLTNCAAPGTALLSPVITGAKTKSMQQATYSLGSSLGSNEVLKKIDKDLKNKIIKKSKRYLDNINTSPKKGWKFSLDK
tara:strand:+ start:190 stop:462 length:273 start_codon:yes stop_codon:yes gene_type:complete